MAMKHLFLRGPLGSGKSTLIRETVIPYLSKVGGFFVQRLFAGDRCRAFCLNPVGLAEKFLLSKCVQRVENEERVFLYCGDDGRWRAKLDVFAVYGLLYLRQGITEGKKLILLDELGGVELHCPAFVQALQETLDSDIRCLGVIKTDLNSRKLDRHLQDKQMNILTRKPLLENLLTHPEVKILDYLSPKDRQARMQVRCFVEEAVAG